MTTIDRMETHYHLAGPPEARRQLARRLDRVAQERLGEALDALTGEEVGLDGSVICIRRLNISILLGGAGLDDGTIARSWAETLMRALYRRMADAGPDEVMRFPSEAAFLAAWLSDLAAGSAGDRWYWREFRLLEGLPPGRAAAAALGRTPQRIGEIFRRLTASGRAEAVIGLFSRADVEAIWQAWCGSEPRAAGPPLAALLAKLPALGIVPPAAEPGTADGRARTALAWLVTLTAGPAPLAAEFAGSLALQLGHLAALLALRPGLSAALAAPVPSLGAARALLARLPDDLATPRNWLRRWLDDPAAIGPLVEALRLVEGRPSSAPARPAAAQPEQRRSAFAGAGLLVPAIATMEIAPRLGPAGLQALLAAAVGQPVAELARRDAGLRWLSGMPDEPAPDGLPAPDWPSAESLGLDPASLARDAETHGESPALPALRAAADRFAEGLRGMPGSSLDYLARQFFHRPGTLIRRPDALTLRLQGLPLGLILRIGGRLGEQGAPDWLGGRLLIVELADG